MTTPQKDPRQVYQFLLQQAVGDASRRALALYDQRNPVPASATVQAYHSPLEGLGDATCALLRAQQIWIGKAPGERDPEKAVAFVSATMAAAATLLALSADVLAVVGGEAADRAMAPAMGIKGDA